jgi:predicted alpha-1,2-mannosidase
MIHRDAKRASRLAALCALLLALTVSRSAQGADDLARYVDPFIGTLGSGFVFPGPAAPYGMVQLSPDTNGYFAYTGYLWSDQAIRGFSHVHVESMGVPEGGNLPFMPTTGTVVTDAAQYQSLFHHASEVASPGYYRVRLDSYGIEAELTAGLRVGMHRYRFPPSKQANVLLDVGRQIAGGSDAAIPQRDPGFYSASIAIEDGRTVSGVANPSLDHPQGYAVYFVARFDRPFCAYGVWRARGAAPEPGVASVAGTGAGAYVTFDTTADPVVLVAVGISFVSVANARENLVAELAGGELDFEALRARTRAAWNEALAVIRVSGSGALDKTSFYTALYHAQHHPNVFNDVNGDYLGHDGARHTIGATGDAMPAGATYYANYSLWDTYRGEMQLLALIAPDRYRDMMRSLAAIAVQGGRLPRWALMNQYPDYEVGSPVLPVIANGYCQGLVPPDALAALYHSARDLALDPVKHRDPDFLSNGYVADGPSDTLEYALADFALALMADGLGETADRDALLALAGNWRNVFDPQTRFVRPRAADGSWKSPYLPASGDGFVEGSGWQYTWLVPHDVRGLFDAMGAPPKRGDRTVRRRLGVFFSTPITMRLPLVTPELQAKLTLFGLTYQGNQYDPGNEPDLQAPYLYDWTAEPWKTQALARAYQGLYRPTPDGLPGNDDLGTMSAWLVWSALGFYPAIPGAPLYVIGSPAFDEAVIRLGDGATFAVRAPGASLIRKYVDSAVLDGSPFERTWLTHDEMIAGGALDFELSVHPNRGWASSDTSRPPSLSSSPLADFGCRP